MRALRGLIATVVLACGAAAQGEAIEEVRRVLANGGHQTELPGDVEGVGGENGRSRGSGWSMPNGLSVGSTAATVLMWGVVGLAIAALVASFVRQAGAAASSAAGPQSAARRGSSPAAPAPSDELTLDDPRLDPSRLAAAGDFAGALRVLLLRMFFLANGGAANVAPHVTARELLRRLRRQRRDVEPVARLVDVVERVHFGGLPADRSMYENAAAACAAFEATLREPVANGAAS